ncbi:uncharacterized protein LOC120695258 [Panicum virgatum]|uniref:uncharacterized protein LOC120695258 n=1 Tax=Panicum virgatum TaxID=38727 RepID=UPI0019D64C29|nr:uncharacterized protein LOC120695258 [Panicum virgatum]
MIRQIRLARVLIDGGSALNIIFAKTPEDMGFDMTKLVPSDKAFYGIITGAVSTSVGNVTHLVTFGTRDNYRTESIIFEVPPCETSYHAILGRPALTKFMVIPNHTYLLLKMPAPNGILSIHGDIQTSHSCETENINTAKAMERSSNQAFVAQAAKTHAKDQLQKPSNNIALGSQLHPDSQTKAIVLSDDHPDKTALIGAELDSA